MSIGPEITLIRGGVLLYHLHHGQERPDKHPHVDRPPPGGMHGISSTHVHAHSVIEFAREPVEKKWGKNGFYFVKK
jgi:hypothetical protein